MKPIPDFGKALVGAWYETMSIMMDDDEAAIAARTAMGERRGRISPATTPSSPARKCSSNLPTPSPLRSEPDLVTTMDSVRSFSDEHGLIEGGMDFVGIAFPGGEVLGDEANIKLRFTEDYMKMAADGAL